MHLSPEHEKLIVYLDKEYRKDEVPEGILAQFRFHHDWVEQAKKEWRLFPGKAYLNREIAYPGGKRCEICDTNLPKNVVHVINNKNQREMYIGLDCEGNVLNGSVVVGRNLSIEEQARYEKFVLEHEKVIALIDHPYSRDSMFELSKVLKLKEDSFRKKAKLLLRQYLKTGKLSQREIQQLLETSDALRAKIDAQNRRYNDDRPGLNVALRNRIEKNQPEDVKAIVRLVQNDDGYLKTDAASRILDEQFLNEYAKRVRQTGGIGSSLDASCTQSARINLSAPTLDGRILLSFPSRDVIQEMGFPKVMVTAKTLSQIVDCSKSIRLANDNQKSLAAITGIHQFENLGFSSVKVSYQDFAAFVGQSEADLKKQQRTRLSPKKYESLISGIAFLKAEDRFVQIGTGELIEIGLRAIIGNFRHLSSDLPSVQVATLSDILKSLYDSYVLKYD
jgi:hypothetical protein